MAASITAAPIPLRLSDGRELLFHPLRDKDIIEIDEWIRAQYIANAINALDRLDSATRERVKDEVFQTAMDKASGLTFLRGEGARALATVAGLSKLLHVSVRRSHPEITEDELRPLLLAEENKDAVNQAFKHVNLPVERPAKDPPRRRRKGRR